MQTNHASAQYPVADDPVSDRLSRRLREACEELWSNFVDPREAFCDDAGMPWLPVGAGSMVWNVVRPLLLTEQELNWIRAECRALAVTHEFAINGHENRISYIVGSGHSYRVTTTKHAQPAPDLVRQAQRILDAFIRENHWHRRQQETVLRCDRDGEAFLRFFLASDGTTRLRFIEPGQVATPSELLGDQAASFGIRTDPEDVETVLEYYVDGQAVPAADVQHRKCNVDANVKRGLPLFFPVRKNLRRAEKLLRNMSIVAEIQSAIALIRKHRTGTRTATQQFVAQQADATVTNSMTGKSDSYHRYAPGTILDAPGGVEYDFPAAALDAGSYVKVLQAELRAIASRLVMPEFMLSSDASNGNYSSTMVAEGPAVRMFQRLQAQQVESDEAVMWRVLRNAVQAGLLADDALEVLCVKAIPPSLAVRDQLQETQAWQIAFQNGILSPQTWSQMCSLDYDQEQANIQAAKNAAPPEPQS
jgi:hypothetical protein